ncbi:MAG: hypothetical protein BWY25_03273 [Chloroflexi bacterium ADurb.Bin222]|nr:MAG: hypothetical protein BWY25_03273 [Chloroflexi bacterium ADurb.Bin222]
MQTTIYACYLPGSTKPDYIGSHSAQPAGTGAAQWRYEHCTYLGQGCWIDKEGIIIAMPRNNRDTEWGKLLLLMSAAERLAIRIEVLEEVAAADRWKAEAQALRDHHPRFNRLIPHSPDDKRLKYPAKLEAKRHADRERIAAKRAAAKQANEPANVA